MTHIDPFTPKTISRATFDMIVRLTTERDEGLAEQADLKAEVERLRAEIADLRRGRKTPTKGSVRPLEATAAPERPPEPPPAERLTGRRESPDPGTAPQERRARYERAIKSVGVLSRAVEAELIRAVVAVADADVAVADADVANLMQRQLGALHERDAARIVNARLIEERDEARACMAVADAEQADLKAEVADAEITAARTDADNRWAGAVAAMRAEIEQASTMAENGRVHCEDLRFEVRDLRKEVDRLRTEATFDRLAAETGAERAQTDVADLKAEADRYAQSWNEAEDDLNEARELLRQANLRAGDTVEADGCIIEAAIADLNEARAILTRVKTLCDDYEPTGLVTVEDLRAALDAPTEPAPNLDTLDGYGEWLADRGLTAHDPPKSSLTAGGVESPLNPPPVDPLTAVRDRLDAAMRGFEAT